ncbi:MAG: HD-GYP domain-containing protein [Treponema sp.]|nr:HD-GYP domain-containing protein [Treponema sp.]
MALFSIPDTVLPVYGIPSFPSSGFGATISFIFLLFFSQNNNTFSISRKNVYDAIYNGTGIAILVLDQNGKLQSGNSVAKEIFGIRKHEHPYVKDLFLNCGEGLVQNIFEGNEIIEHALSRGSKTPMALDSIVYKDKFGGVYGYIILATDATADELVLEQKLIIESEKEKSRRIKKLSDQVVATLSLTIDAKDKYTNGHSSRVAKYSLMIGRELGLSEEKLQTLEYSALLHDIGKIGIPDYIINKSTTLTGEEYSVIKTHPGIGANILSNITELPDLSIGARWHHERYDGTGYPDGKKGTETDLTARIIGVADAYDAMTSNRSYRHYLSQDKVRDELVRNKGIQFDPEIADIMIRIIDSDKDYRLHEDT